MADPVAIGTNSVRYMLNQGGLARSNADLARVVSRLNRNLDK